MKFNFRFLLFLCCGFSIAACAQAPELIPPSNNDSLLNQWQTLASGADYMEMEAPKKSAINDSRISILKLNPATFEMKLLSATAEDDQKPKTASEWAEKYELNVVVNAGMYDLAKKMLSKGYLKSENHINNPTLYPNYNAMIAFNPKDSLKSKFTVLDLKCEDWDKVKTDYHCYAQGLRMIDCNRQPLSWNKKNQSCSMLVTAVDALGNIYFIFSRSPYTHNEMIEFMLAFPFQLNNAIYMEGGPQTSLFIQFGDRKIEKIGSYVSETYPNDLNDHFWTLPNVIGFKVKSITNE